MNPENEAKEENLEQDGKVTEQLPEQKNNQDALEPAVSAHDSKPLGTASEQPDTPAGAQSGASAAPLTQESFQPVPFAKETGAETGKIATFFQKTWVKAVTLVGVAILLFMGGMGSGMAISNEGPHGHMPPGHGGQMAPGGQMDKNFAPGGKMGPGANGPGQLQPGMNQQPGQMAPGSGNQNPPQGQNQQQGKQNPKQQDKQGENNSQNSSSGTSDSQNKSATPSNNS